MVGKLTKSQNHPRRVTQNLRDAVVCGMKRVQASGFQVQPSVISGAQRRTLNPCRHSGSTCRKTKAKRPISNRTAAAGQESLHRKKVENKFNSSFGTSPFCDVLLPACLLWLRLCRALCGALCHCSLKTYIYIYIYTYTPMQPGSR